MAGMQNIGNTSDPFYRYKMDHMTVNYTGKNQNTRTHLTNLDAISKQLITKSSYIIKFMSSRLGTLGKYDTKIQTWYLKGRVGIEVLSNLLNEFIEIYVKCIICGNPETYLIAKRGKPLCMRCFACGNKCTPYDKKDTKDTVPKMILRDPQDITQYKKRYSDKKQERKKMETQLEAQFAASVSFS